MNPIEQTILSVLNSASFNRGFNLASSEDCKELASLIATELVQASLTQLASHLHDNVPSSLFEGFCNELDVNPTEVP